MEDFMTAETFSVGDRVVLSRVPFDEIVGKTGTVILVRAGYVEARVDGIGTDQNYPVGCCVAKPESFDHLPTQN
jgi:hypothetical protein